MGRTQYWMNVSLDLFIDRLGERAGQGDWLSIDRELHETFNGRARALSLMVQGRVVHEIMEGSWPAMAEDPSLDPWLREYGRIWLAAPKVLVSNTRTDAQHNTRILGGPGAIEAIGRLRAETPGVVGVGGATLATALLRAGLLDELLLFTHPVTLGRGRPLFDPPAPELTLAILEHQAFGSGVTMHRYQVERFAPGGP